MDIGTATASEIYRALVDIEDRLLELAAEDRLVLEQNAERTRGTVRDAVDQINTHLDEARQVLAWLETRDQGDPRAADG
ncbi:hypothetical protein HER39_19200 [Arthrobacter deserti]|uniref:Uncharacterized protein n=1 Tax=Arthrobacter deserti TaxID=1742687 RepID=A0ABX1JTM7_9MICC|nr:hypothetical protein [Arthrobacter deserti]